MATFFAGSPPTGSRNPCLSLCICGFGVQHEEDTDNDMCPGCIQTQLPDCVVPTDARGIGSSRGMGQLEGDDGLELPPMPPGGSAQDLPAGGGGGGAHRGTSRRDLQL